MTELEGQAFDVGRDESKHDPTLEEEAMTQWVGSLDPESRAQVLNELDRWVLAQPLNAWRARVALRIAATFSSDRAIDAAITRLEREDLPAEPLELDLIEALSRHPTGRGLRYLEFQAGRAKTAATYRERRAAIRAMITLCFLSAEDEFACLTSTLQLLRSFKDPNLTRTGLGLIRNLFLTRRDDHALVRRVLTPDELSFIS